MSRPKILVVRLGAFGDVAMALVALRALRSGLPEAEISWLVERRHAAVLAFNADVDDVISLPDDEWRRAPLAPSTARAVIGQLRALRRRRFDVALDLQGLLKSAFWVRASGAGVRVGLPRGWLRERVAAAALTARAQSPSGCRHVVDAYVAVAHETVRRLGGRVVTPEQAGLVQLSADERSRAEQILERHGAGPLVVLSPGAAWVTKLWPAARYGALAERLAREAGATVLVAHGPGEEQLAAEVVDAAGDVHVVAQPGDIRQLAAILERADLYVGADSGPYHLAQRMGTKTVALFGPTDPARNGPRDPDDEVVWGKMACSPCYGRSCPTEIECMDAIDVEAVASACRIRLDR